MSRLARLGLLTLASLMFAASLAHSAAAIAQSANSAARGTTDSDPGSFVTADITGVELVQTESGTVLNVKGTIDADQFKRAWMKIGAGEKPETWTYVGQKRKYAIHDGILGVIPLGQFTDSGIWQVVIYVEHRNGTEKSDMYPVNIK